MFDMWLPNGHRQIVCEFSSRDDAYVVLTDAEGLESRSRRSLLSPADVEHFHRLGLLGEVEARVFLGRSPNVSWDELRERYERTSAARCRPETHLKNMSRVVQVIRRISEGVPHPSKCSREGIEWCPKLLTRSSAKSPRASRFTTCATRASRHGWSKEYQPPWSGVLRAISGSRPPKGIRTSL